jgi:hypothetical protein
MKHDHTSVSWLRVVRVIGVVIAAIVLAAASFDPAIGWIIPLGLGGGALIATVLLAVASRRGHAAPVVDRFARNEMDGIINISRVRVAGLGGLGLVLAASGVALQYQLTTVAIGAGLIGGALTGLLLIVSRRPRRASH